MKSEGNRKLKITVVFTLCLLLLLGYGTFLQWRSKTLLFMHGYKVLYRSVWATVSYLDMYLQSEDMEHLRLATQTLEVASNQSNIFNSYCGSELGISLTYKFYSFLNPSQLYENGNNRDFLLKYVAELKVVSDALFQPGDGWLYAAVPRHPITKKRLINILGALEKVVE